jgi:hypothetical protein
MREVSVEPQVEPGVLRLGILLASYCVPAKLIIEKSVNDLPLLRRLPWLASLSLSACFVSRLLAAGAVACL